MDSLLNMLTGEDRQKLASVAPYRYKLASNLTLSDRQKLADAIVPPATTPSTAPAPSITPPSTVPTIPFAPATGTGTLSRAFGNQAPAAGLGAPSGAPAAASSQGFYNGMKTPATNMGGQHWAGSAGNLRSAATPLSKANYLGRIGQVARGAPKFMASNMGMPWMVAGMGIEAGGNYLAKRLGSHKTLAGRLAHRGTNALHMGTTGAMIGSMFGVPGMIIGGLGGLAGGAIYQGLYGKNDSDEYNNKLKELEGGYKQMLAERLQQVAPTQFAANPKLLDDPTLQKGLLGDMIENLTKQHEAGKSPTVRDFNPLQARQQLKSDYNYTVY